MLGAEPGHVHLPLRVPHDSALDVHPLLLSAAISPLEFHRIVCSWTGRPSLLLCQESPVELRDDEFLGLLEPNGLVIEARAKGVPEGVVQAPLRAVDLLGHVKSVVHHLFPFL